MSQSRSLLKVGPTEFPVGLDGEHVCVCERGEGQDHSKVFILSNQKEGLALPESGRL